ncbi:IS5 family transposase [Myxococcus xanthus]|nr:IS5 family transposase [Myxococcus xanthus]
MDYIYNSLRAWCRVHRLQSVIPTRTDKLHQRTFCHRGYRKRCRVECLFNRLKQSRRVATRYEKRAANYLAMVLIASIRL